MDETLTFKHVVVKNSCMMASGGYSCQFVDTIPKELQTECSICLHTVRDPYMVDCCGYRFCKACIMPIYVEFGKCPLCNCAFSSVIHDKLLQRTLNEKPVYCTHKDAGCDWTGKLVTLDHHLNAVPGDSKQPQHMEGCSMQSLKCSYCDDTFKRRDMLDHESKCPRRPITCIHCETFSAPQVKLEDHWKECKSYPLQCENKCGETVTREKMDEHLKKKCPLVVIACEYSYAGCDVTLPRKEMAAHMDEAAKEHLQLVTKLLTKHTEELQSVQRKLDYVQMELMIRDMDKEQEIACKDNELALKDDTIDELKRLCDLRDDYGDADNQVLVSNFSETDTEHVLKSMFGQFGRIRNVEFYPWRSMAVIEFEHYSSVDRLFDRYDTRGIRLRGASLDCTRLSY